MFICNDCLKKAYVNRPSLFRSYGRCEFCERVKDCNDIPSWALTLRATAHRGGRRRVEVEK